MKNYRALSSLLVLISLGCLYSCKAPQRLAWKLKPQETYTVNVHLVSDLAMMFAGVDHKDTRMLLDCRVKQLDEKQRAEVEVTISSLKAGFSTLGRKFSFDSDNDPGLKTPAKGKAGQEQTFINAFTGLKGQKYTVLVDPEQHAIKLLKMDDLINKAAYAGSGGSMLGGDQVTQLLAAGNLQEYVTGGLFTGMGTSPAKLNKSWTRSASIVVPYAPVTPTLNTYTITKIETLPGKKGRKNDEIVRINYKVTDAEASSDSGQHRNRKNKSHSKKSFSVESIEGEGEIIFSLSAGHLLSLNEKTKVFVKSKFSRRTNPSKDQKKRKPPKIFYTVQKTIEYVEKQ